MKFGYENRTKINVYLEPIVDLLKDEMVQEKIGEVARFFYTNDTVTINLYYAAAAVLLGFLCKSSSSSIS